MTSFADESNSTFIYRPRWCIHLPTMDILSVHCNKWLSITLNCWPSLNYAQHEMPASSLDGVSVLCTLVMNFCHAWRSLHFLTALNGILKSRLMSPRLSHCHFGIIHSRLIHSSFMLLNLAVLGNNLSFICLTYTGILHIIHFTVVYLLASFRIFVSHLNRFYGACTSIQKLI
jgi:hypothetical protein